MENKKYCLPPQKWFKPDGSVVSCTESVKVLTENWCELRTQFKEVLEDAVLMGCTVKQVKDEYKRLIDEMPCDYKETEEKC